MPPRTVATGVVEVARVRSALADRYRIERVLGEGGMATVYLAEDLKHHRKVAVKVMRPELAATLGADRFLREVEIAAQLSHPHILPMYDSGESDGLLYYVMPHIEGESLRSLLQREGQLSVEDAVRLAREVAEALAYAHERNIIHRDIKPANILLSAGHALVADFGIARAIGAQGEALTQTGLAVGTPHYMAPEQASGHRDVDARADVYAVGAVLYEMLAGEPPFTGPNPQAIIARTLTETPRSLTATRPAIPTALDAVTTRALARSPADRFPTAAALSQALAGAATPTGSGPLPAIEPERGPAPALVWGLYGLGAVAGLGVVYTMMRRLGLPAWTLALAVALLAVGALVLITTGRVEARRRSGAQPAGLMRWFTWTNSAIGGVLALGVWALAATAFAVRGPGGGGGDGVRLAVLPFEIRGSTEDAYVADGIADEIRGKLTGLPGFRVTARSSSDQYRGTDKSIQQMGRELGVEYVLTATVRLIRNPGATDRLQVVPELIATRTGEATWQQTFDADLTDVFQVQSQIASRVAGALGMALGGTEERQLASRPTENLAAWDLYQKGRGLTTGDPATLRQQAGYFEQAAALDPAFTDAWAGLAMSLSGLYFMGTPEAVIATRAREAAERALEAGRDRPIAQVAMARYLDMVMKDQVRAEEYMIQALRAAPNDPEILTAAARLEQNLGRWDDALTHLERARRLDPRSASTVGLLRGVLLYLRRHAEAREVGDDALSLAPADPTNILNQVMVFLAQGDMEGARGVIRATPGSLAQPALVAFLATYQDLYWVLDEAQQRLLLRLPPSAFFDDPAAWGSVFMQTWWLRGERERARAYADTAHMAFEEQLKGAPNDAQLHVLNGLALAYMGRKDEAIAAGERGVALEPISRDARNGPYIQHQLVRIYTMVGEYEKALDRLEPLLRIPYYLTPAWLRIDPSFAPLKGHPRFERLLAGS